MEATEKEDEAVMSLSWWYYDGTEVADSWHPL